MRQGTIEELAEETQMPIRTIRYYIAEGMLPRPSGRGRAAAYGEEHLARLRLIRLLLDRHLPLAVIREQLAGLALADVQALLREEEHRHTALHTAAEARSPKRYIAELLQQTYAPEQARPVQPAVPPPVASASMPPAFEQLPAVSPAAPRAEAPPEVPVAEHQFASIRKPLRARSARSSFTDAASVSDGEGRELWQHIPVTSEVQLLVRAEAAERLRPLLDAMIAVARRASLPS